MGQFDHLDGVLPIKLKFGMHKDIEGDSRQSITAGDFVIGFHDDKNASFYFFNKEEEGEPQYETGSVYMATGNNGSYKVGMMPPPGVGMFCGQDYNSSPFYAVPEFITSYDGVSVKNQFYGRRTYESDGKITYGPLFDTGASFTINGATDLQAGLMTTDTQQFSGDKTFLNVLSQQSDNARTTNFPPKYISLDSTQCIEFNFGTIKNLARRICIEIKGHSYSSMPLNSVYMFYPKTDSPYYYQMSGYCYGLNTGDLVVYVDGNNELKAQLHYAANQVTIAITTYISGSGNTIIPTINYNSTRITNGAAVKYKFTITPTTYTTAGKGKILMSNGTNQNPIFGTPSMSWTEAIKSGPVFNYIINDTTIEGIAIPSASDIRSGIITAQSEQSFSGNKTFRHYISTDNFDKDNKFSLNDYSHSGITILSSLNQDNLPTALTADQQDPNIVFKRDYGNESRGRLLYNGIFNFISSDNENGRATIDANIRTGKIGFVNSDSSESYGGFTVYDDPNSSLYCDLAIGSASRPGRFSLFDNKGKYVGISYEDNATNNSFIKIAKDLGGNDYFSTTDGNAIDTWQTQTYQFLLYAEGDITSRYRRIEAIKLITKKDDDVNDKDDASLTLELGKTDNYGNYVKEIILAGRNSGNYTKIHPKFGGSDNSFQSDLYLPTKAGSSYLTFIATDTADVGSALHPVYVDKSGELKTCAMFGYDASNNEKTQPDSNRLIYRNTQTAYLSTANHYIDETHLAINSTAMPDTTSAFYVNGSAKIANDLNLSGSLTFVDAAKDRYITFMKTNAGGDWRIGHLGSKDVGNSHIVLETTNGTASTWTRIVEITPNTPAKINITGNENITGTLGVTGATTLSSTLGVTGVTTISNTTESSSSTTGALKVSGGVYIAKQLRVGGNTTLSSSLTVTGTTTLKNTLYIKNANDGTEGSFSTSSSTATTAVATILTVGNSTAVETAGNRYGILRIYNQESKYADIRPRPTGATTNSTFYLPQGSVASIYATWYSGSATGSASLPVYIDSTGKAVACTTSSSTNGWFNKVLRSDSSGITELGRYLDFHATNDSANTYDVRIDATTDAGKNTLYLPGVTGQFVIHTNNTAIGDSDEPVYIASTGMATKCSGVVVTTGEQTFSGNKTFSGAITLSSTLGVTGVTTLKNKLTITDSNNYEGGSFQTTASTATTSVSTNLIVGNAKASGTAGNRYGILQIYSEGTSYINLRVHRYAANGSTNATSRTTYLRDHGADAYLVATTTRDAVGSTSVPVYVSTSGVITECSSYAGGTAITLNGTSKAANTASFYAPTSSGTAGYILKSGGSGVAPSWIQYVPITNGGTGATSITASRLLYNDGATTPKITASSHYISSTKIAINSTSAPTENLYVNGSTKITGNTTLGDGQSNTIKINGKTILKSDVTYGTKNPEEIYTTTTAGSATTPVEGQIYFKIIS